MACAIALLVTCPVALGVPATWSQIGDNQPNNPVHALDVEGGTLWVGGSFTQLPYLTPRAGVARWDGSSWSSAGAGTSDTVYAVEATPTGTLYAGGDFSSAGGGALRMLAQWNGSSWSSVGAVSGASDEVRAAVWSAGTLYIGGQFYDIGGSYVPADKIAKWDGTSWSTLGFAWGSGPTMIVKALAVDGSGNVYAGGDFTTVQGAPANYLAKWNGTSWSAVGSGVDGVVNALAVDGSGNLYVGGAFTTAGGMAANHLAKWNGSSWSALGTGVNSTVNALEPVEYCGQTVLYAGGAFTSAGGASAGKVAAWDGAQWSPVGVGLGASGDVFALAASGPGKLYAGGSFVLPSPYPTYVGQADVTNRACAPSNAIAASTTPEAAMVQWDNPMSGPGWDDLVVTASPGGRACSTPTGSTCTITGLTNGTAYTFAVKAVNGAGDSPLSNVTAAVTPVGPPTAPTGVTAVAGQEQATVSWTVPASDEGSPIVGYTATASPGGRACSTTSATTCTVTGLTAGTPYTFAVRAANSVGSSSASAASDAVTPTAPPAASPASAPASEPASAPRAPALRVAVRVRGGTATSTGTVPSGATSITQTARSGGAASQRFLALAGVRTKAVAGRCAIRKQRYTCTIRLAKGTWSVTTTARGKAGVVAESSRSVVIR